MPASTADVVGALRGWRWGPTTGSPVMGWALAAASLTLTSTREAYWSSAQMFCASWVAGTFGSLQPRSVGWVRPRVATWSIANVSPKAFSIWTLSRPTWSPVTLVLLLPNTV